MNIKQRKYMKHTHTKNKTTETKNVKPENQSPYCTRKSSITLKISSLRNKRQKSTKIPN